MTVDCYAGLNQLGTPPSYAATIDRNDALGLSYSSTTHCDGMHIACSDTEGQQPPTGIEHGRRQGCGLVCSQPRGLDTGAPAISALCRR